jgi:hypothetical protein
MDVTECKKEEKEEDNIKSNISKAIRSIFITPKIMSKTKSKTMKKNMNKSIAATFKLNLRSHPLKTSTKPKSMITKSKKSTSRTATKNHYWLTIIQPMKNSKKNLLTKKENLKGHKKRNKQLQSSSTSNSQMLGRYMGKLLTNKPIQLQ